MVLFEYVLKRSLNLSRAIRKPDFAYVKTKAADQLCGNCTTDQRLRFCYIESTISELLKYEISSL